MIVKVTPQNGSVELVDPHAFDGFHVEAPADATPSEVSAALGTAEAGSPSNDHVWVRVDQVRGLAPAGDATWSAGFEAMLAYAQGKGWMNAGGDMIMAHLVAASSG